MQVSAIPRGYLSSLPSENFYRQVRKRHVTTFLTRAWKRGNTAQSACEGWLCQASGVFATTCFPSRLSRVRAPSPAPLAQSLHPEVLFK